MKSILTLGVMSGTSLDGVDLALCAIGPREFVLRERWSVAFPRALQRRLRAVAAGEASGWELAQVHHDLGRFYVEAVERGPGGVRPGLVGLHGQTVFHQPDPRGPATLQIGEPAYLAERLRVPVVSNFRAADLAAGGQGAPLATAFHLRAFGLRGRHVCVQNLGGIGNVTSLDWRGRPGRRGAAPARSEPSVLAFDTGPANVLLDLAARAASGGRRTCDRDGRGALRGRVCEPLVEAWLEHPYFRLSPPKSTGRELFGEPFFREVEAAARRRRLGWDDVLASLTELTARSIALSYARFLPACPEVVILAGGGARNPAIRSALARSLVREGLETSLVTSDEAGWPVESVEAAAFAWLAWLRWQGQPGNLPATTGARRAVLCGQVT